VHRKIKEILDLRAKHKVLKSQGNP
jgi:hypothetical protein